MSDPVVIVGAGLAGYNLARELRKASAELPIVVVSQDGAEFYSKPMLSNALASGKTAATLVMKSAEKMAEELRAPVLPRTRVTQVDADAQILTLDSDEVLRYRDLVLAVGADPVRLPLQGDSADAVLSVNDLDDFARFAQTLDTAAAGQPAQRVVILGAGLIGCEFANDLLARGVAPTVVDVADRVVARLLPAEASAQLQARLEAAGAQFKLGVSVAAVNRGADGLIVVLNDGSSLQADLVVSAVGLKPRTDLAAQAGATVTLGVQVNRLLATNVPHVHALGDCAEVEGQWLPYVMPLMQQARALAATLAGMHTPVTYPAMPVVVKTPAWPTVVCSPPVGTNGQWQFHVTEDALEGRFVSDEADTAGQLRGFVLQGKAVSQRQALTAQLPAPMPVPAT
ncbi:MAG: FAD-dependent oxidoreductase [Aquabacterium sp.]|jgi:rubredoxin-NAD+ reductase|uniref:NAD(P)/FAD-dependent oxidoreductase n=1 Tax=Aquabacterium sp. TaxID=1872578 RepID=UPI002A36A0E9|nr:FAD-dependent oxidoreductase [Aquabacterium sp.]MDX9845275.1 FAD-dependent oxidoreductase [Aquabacterium sp.]